MNKIKDELDVLQESKKNVECKCYLGEKLISVLSADLFSWERYNDDFWLFFYESRVIANVPEIFIDVVRNEIKVVYNIV